MTSCPGTDTCKLGISASRGLTGELRKRLTLVEDRARPGGASASHEGERLLQLLRPAPRGRHRIHRRQPTGRRPQGPALQHRARRPVDRERQELRPGGRRGSVEEHPEGRRADHGALPQQPRGRRELPGVHGARRQEGVPQGARADSEAARLRRRPELLQRLGQPARVHDRRHRRRRVRRGDRPVRRVRAPRGRAAAPRCAGRARSGPGRAAAAGAFTRW